MKYFKYLFCFVLLLPVVATAQPNIQIENAYIRELPPTAETAAVYLTINNSGQHPLTLAQVSSDAAQSAMIHLSSMQNGMMVMEHLMSLELPPGETVVFEPGALHIMLSGLRRPLIAGDSIKLNFSFSNGLVLTTTVPVISNN